SLLTKADFHPIAFISKAFNKHEQYYAASEKEALAVVEACKKFRNYVYAQPVCVITDCVALKTLLSCKTLSEKLARWAIIIQEINPTILYRAGRANEFADGLSRKPMTEWDKMLAEKDPVDKDQPIFVTQIKCDILDERMTPFTENLVRIAKIKTKRTKRPETFDAAYTAQTENDYLSVCEAQQRDPRINAVIQYHETGTVNTEYASY
ncbi:MAG: hypothetical protein GY738_18175, partial [Pseudoalteromonas sp.]|nr:hypothetical protein [Pseudoalteromonas sp.]